MPLVYVHGIANRRERGAHREDALRDAMFREHLLARLTGGAAHTVRTAHWGDLGGSLAWNGDSFPQGRVEMLGGDDPLAELSQEVIDDIARTTEPEPHRLVLDVALRSLPDALDLLFVAAGLSGTSQLPADGLARLSRILTDQYEDTDRPGRGGELHPWLTGLRSDADLIEALAARADEKDGPAPGNKASARTPLPAQRETLGNRSLSGAWKSLRSGAGRLGRTAASRLLARPVARLRTAGVEKVPLLIGDVTAYLARRGTREEPGPLVRRVAGVLDEAMAERTDDLPLYVIAHSMGGNIVHDILTHYRPELRVDALVTVGSQVGLFEELKLFRESDPAVTGGSGARVPRAAAAARWLNVVDEADPLAFHAEPVFSGVTDYTYASGRPWAHSAALHQPTFHARLARRLVEGVPDTGAR
ncbi:serine aminopeptidase domain-containing protein [Streptomyces sp. NPDC014746]|uniref:serine aminopeptidase domain-containing protein n=1 Tax=Streptomyces sp. NPDC014746 TaxID=3364904 RepID=UPI0036F523CF